MTSLSGLLLLATLALSPAQASGPAPVEQVRELYAAADYESALTALDGLAASKDPAETIEIERYRALCLMALGRTSDAEVAIERIVRLDPMYQPDEQEAPRVRAAFASVRARILPLVARNLYTDAKAAYDRREYTTAVPAFERAMGVLDSLESNDPALGDLRTLASGFLDLSRAAIPPEPVVPPPPVAPPPVQEKPAAPEPVQAVEPVAIAQVLPPWNAAWLGAQGQLEFRGVVEVVIDETGAVTSAGIVKTVHPAYDPQLLEAASRWRYQPARRNGKPVVSIKRVEVVLRPRD